MVNVCGLISLSTAITTETRMQETTCDPVDGNGDCTITQVAMNSNSACVDISLSL